MKIKACYQRDLLQNMLELNFRLFLNYLRDCRRTKIDWCSLTSFCLSEKITRVGGDISRFFTLVPKVLWYRFFFNYFGDLYLILIVWIIQLNISTVQPLIVLNLQRGVIVCIIIGNVHQSIGHCLIPDSSLKNNTFF